MYLDSLAANAAILSLMPASLLLKSCWYIALPGLCGFPWEKRNACLILAGRSAVKEIFYGIGKILGWCFFEHTWQTVLHTCLVDFACASHTVNVQHAFYSRTLGDVLEWTSFSIWNWYEIYVSINVKSPNTKNKDSNSKSIQVRLNYFIYNSYEVRPF